jgi:hypothetical protein
MNSSMRWARAPEAETEQSTCLDPLERTPDLDDTNATTEGASLHPCGPVPIHLGLMKGDGR